jgi:hypothetical protein
VAKIFTLPADAATRPASIPMRVFLARVEHKDNRGEAMTMLECATRIAVAQGKAVPALAVASKTPAKAFVLPADAATRAASPNMRMKLYRLERKDNRSEVLTMLQCAERISKASGEPMPALAVSTTQE